MADGAGGGSHNMTRLSGAEPEWKTAPSCATKELIYKYVFEETEDVELALWHSDPTYTRKVVLEMERLRYDLRPRFREKRPAPVAKKPAAKKQ
jgi:hypothetical protein